MEWDNERKFRESFAGADFKGGIFRNCFFEGCDFTQAVFVGAKWIDCKFVKCNLSLTKWEGARIQDLVFEECKIMGVNFYRCDPMFLKLAFRQCLIDTCNFSNLNLKNTVFKGSVVRETYFSQADLSGADFQNCDLKGSVFHQSDLRNANFEGAFHFAIDPMASKLKGARFSKENAVGLLASLGIIIN